MWQIELIPNVAWRKTTDLTPYKHQMCKPFDKLVRGRNPLFTRTIILPVPKPKRVVLPQHTAQHQNQLHEGGTYSEEIYRTVPFSNLQRSLVVLHTANFQSSMSIFSMLG